MIDTISSTLFTRVLLGMFLGASVILILHWWTKRAELNRLLVVRLLTYRTIFNIQFLSLLLFQVLPPNISVILTDLVTNSFLFLQNRLYVYPIKSCRGVAVPSIEFDDFGVVNDRRFVVVDERDNFISMVC